MLYRNMTVLSVLALVLALMPVLATIIFRSYMVSRKKKELGDEIRRLDGETSEYVQNRGGLEQVNQLVEARFRWRSLLFPSMIISFLYCVAFLLCLAYVNRAGNGAGASWFVPDQFLNEQFRLVLFTFMGVYLFNIGTLVRRVYLIDLTEQVFWGATYRLLLAIGLAIAIAVAAFRGQAPASTSTGILTGSLATAVGNSLEIFFFAIGFLADVILDWVLELAMKTANINTVKRDDFSLRMVRGINIWKDFRLEEEGIENAQNLATADVIDLAVKTHYPLRTLIDWVDQAIVICRFGVKSKDLEAAGLNISAIELAWLAPEATGKTDVVDAIQATTAMRPAFITAQLNSLYEDAQVRELWTLWQRKPEFDRNTVRIPITPVPPPHGPEAKGNLPEEQQPV